MKLIITQLEGQNEDLKRYLDLAGYIIVSLDKNGNINLLNRKGYEILGYEENELLGKNWFETCLPETIRDETFDVFKELIRGELNPVEFHQNPIITSTGIERIISWYNALLYDDDGIISGMVCSGEDITEKAKIEQELKESEEKFKTITEQSVASISIFQNSEIIYINKVFSEVIGYPYKKIISWEVDGLLEKVIHPDDLERVMNLSKKTRAGLTDTLQNTQFKIIRKDGEIKWIDSFFKSIPYKGKHGALNFFLDMTVQKNEKRELKRLTEDLEKKVEFRTKELKESEEKYRILADQSQIGIFIIQDNQIKYINKTAAKIIGYTRKEVENWSLEDFAKLIHPEDRYFMLEQALKKQEGTEEILDNYDFRFFNKNGELIWGHNLSKTIIYEGKPADLVTQIYITERKEIEQKLKESEEKLKKSEWEKNIILESISELITFYDVNNIILWANQAAGESLNIQPDDMVGQKCYELWHDRNEVCDDCPIEDSIKSGSPHSGEIITPDGRVWAMKGFPVKDEEGKVIGAVEVTSEITKLKKAEEKVREVNERMDLYRSIFAHDISNIFNNVKMAAELCKPYLNDPTQLEKISELHRIISEQIIRGDKLIRNVKRLSSLEESKFPVKREQVRQIIENSIEFLYNSYPNREIIVNKEIANGSIIANVNELLQDVFENILFNAVKHNKSPRIEISLVVSKLEIEKKKFIKLEFKDNGKGISDKRKQLIFQRGKDLVKKKGGMGLGLSLVKKIIDSYGGKIWVEARVKGDYKKGSNFIILIPEAT